MLLVWVCTCGKLCNFASTNICEFGTNLQALINCTLHHIQIGKYVGARGEPGLPGADLGVRGEGKERARREEEAQDERKHRRRGQHKFQEEEEGCRGELN